MTDLYNGLIQFRIHIDSDKYLITCTLICSIYPASSKVQIIPHFKNNINEKDYKNNINIFSNDLEKYLYIDKLNFQHLSKTCEYLQSNNQFKNYIDVIIDVPWEEVLYNLLPPLSSRGDMIINHNQNASYNWVQRRKVILNEIIDCINNYYKSYKKDSNNCCNNYNPCRIEFIKYQMKQIFIDPKDIVQPIQQEDLEFIIYYLVSSKFNIFKYYVVPSWKAVFLGMINPIDNSKEIFYLSVERFEKLTIPILFDLFSGFYSLWKLPKEFETDYKEWSMSKYSFKKLCKNIIDNNQINFVNNNIKYDGILYPRTMRNWNNETLSQVSQNNFDNKENDIYYEVPLLNKKLNNNNNEKNTKQKNFDSTIFKNIPGTILVHEYDDQT